MININTMIGLKEDDKEIRRVAEIVKKMALIDKDYVNSESDVIAQKQPFLISLLLGYQFDVKGHELEVIMKMIFLIWEFFKNHRQIQQSKVSESQFIKIQQRNIHMLNYFGGEQGRDAKMKLLAADLRFLKSKSLFAAILFQFDEEPVLSGMNNENKGIVLIGLKSLIECFEEIVYKK